MSYLVLARKYRPQSFDDLVGQSHVARTLANAIAQNRVAHAFLFTGVRGVGKTTSARLLAKCLNCLGPPGVDHAGQGPGVPSGKATGPTATPCQVCAACKEIAAGTDIDVQEIDGASYNGVDEVRRLQEGIAFRPARDRFKIYIVDEVHMLSNAAWNAFLKTLEEPPPHVKFIFATTEVHKVPVTILSRCQRYDFKLIPTQTIAARLKEVLGLEKIEAEDAAVAVLAREAAGSMRDAMSLLDQVIAFSGENLTADDVARVLGVADRAILHELASALVAGDAPAALKVVDRIAHQGFDLAHVAKDVLRHLRDLVVAKVCGEGADRELLDLADEEVADVRELAKKSDADDLQRLFQGFSKSFDEIVKSGQPRTALEMTLVRLARRPQLLPLDELLARLGDLEKRLASGAPPPAGPSRGPGEGPPRGPRSSGSREGMQSSSAPVFTPPSWEPPSPGRPTSEAPRDRTRGSLALATPLPTARAKQVEPEFVAPEIPEPIAAPAPSESAPVAPRSPQKLEASACFETWRAIHRRMRDADARVASIFDHAVPIEANAQRVLVGFPPDGFGGAQASQPESIELLQRESRSHFGVETKVALDLSARPGVTIADVEREEKREALAKARAAVEQHPVVKKAIALFGAELKEVKLPGGDD